ISALVLALFRSRRSATRPAPLRQPTATRTVILGVSLRSVVTVKARDVFPAAHRPAYRAHIAVAEPGGQRLHGGVREQVSLARTPVPDLVQLGAPRGPPFGEPPLQGPDADGHAPGHLVDAARRTVLHHPRQDRP